MMLSSSSSGACLCSHQQVKSLKRNPLVTDQRCSAVGRWVSLEQALTFQTSVFRANLINQTAQIDSGSTVGTSSPWEAVSTDDGDDDAFGLFSRMTSFWQAERLTTTDIDTQIERGRKTLDEFIVILWDDRASESSVKQERESCKHEL